MNSRYVLRRVGAALLSLIFVLALNFVLFRMVKSDPVGSAVPRAQRLAGSQGQAAGRVRARQVHARAVRQLPRADRAGQPRDLVLDPPAGGRRRSRAKIWPTVLLVGLVDDPLGGHRGVRRHPRRRGDATARSTAGRPARRCSRTRSRTSTSASCCSRSSRSGSRGYPPAAWRRPGSGGVFDTVTAPDPPVRRARDLVLR